MTGEQLELGSAASETRAAEIERHWAAFHARNPRVWELFQKYTWLVISAGHRHYSADAVLHRIRWHEMVETSAAGRLATGEPLKINNNFSAYYARLFHQSFPEFDGFFRNRALVSERAEPRRPESDWTRTQYRRCKR